MKRIGGGGNGTVWQAERDGRVAALKMLKDDSKYRRKRFIAEIEAMLSCRDHPGVLPMVDCHLPDSAKPAWLATEIAREATTALGAKPAVPRVVEAVHSYALTLADLCDRRVSHRDVKPNNLFEYEGRWVIGDFGLATYPSKEALTRAHRKLGPLYFMAPEMLDAADRSDPGLADVYSLGKTLWALAARKAEPPQGQVRLEVPKHRLRHWIEDEERTDSLDLLIESVTSDEPSARGTMRAFASELEAWLAGGGPTSDQVDEIRRERYLAAVGELLSKSVDDDDLRNVEEGTQRLVAQARQRITENQLQLRRQSYTAAERSHQSSLRINGVAVVAGLNNSPWIGSVRVGRDFADAVLHRPKASRQTEIAAYWNAVDETYRPLVRGGSELRRPLWWMHTVLLSGCLLLRGKKGCEPLATDLARTEVHDQLTGFANSPVDAASWRLQRVLIPVIARVAHLAPIDAVAHQLTRRQTAEDRIRYPITPRSVLMFNVRSSAQQYLASLEPWTVERLDAETKSLRNLLDRLPIPNAAWVGPGGGDDWLQSWANRDVVLMCGLSVLCDEPSGDDLINTDELRGIVVAAAQSEDGLLRRVGLPLAGRLGLMPENET